jgi:hypothetical protein
MDKLENAKADAANGSEYLKALEDEATLLER